MKFCHKLCPKIDAKMMQLGTLTKYIPRPPCLERVSRNAGQVGGPTGRNLTACCPWWGRRMLAQITRRILHSLRICDVLSENESRQAPKGMRLHKRCTLWAEFWKPARFCCSWLERMCYANITAALELFS